MFEVLNRKPANHCFVIISFANSQSSSSVGTYECGFLFALVSSTENIEVSTTAFARTLVDVHSPKIDIDTAGSPLKKKNRNSVKLSFMFVFHCNIHPIFSLFALLNHERNCKHTCIRHLLIVPTFSIL